MEPVLEEQFVVFLDFLGTRDAIASDERAPDLLRLLTEVKALRSEQQVNATPTDGRGSRRIDFFPAVSTFSDHLVVSYSLDRLRRDAALAEVHIASWVHLMARDLVAYVAAGALRLGFLVRGGATIGSLFHADGIVFGEALVESYLIESQTSVYPRVVVSRKAMDRRDWGGVPLHVGEDGIGALDYWPHMLNQSVRANRQGQAGAKEWFERVVEIIGTELADLKKEGKLNEYAKWAWFARQFREAIVSLGAPLVEELGISAEMVPVAGRDS